MKFFFRAGPFGGIYGGHDKNECEKVEYHFLVDKIFG
jgi:hypothetical protein